MYEELIQRAKTLDEKATPGPWMWDMRTAHHACKLVTAHSGQYYVMQFSRWGMQDACPEFQQFKKYSGPVTERGGLGMVRADKMAKSYPGKEHHKGFDDYIDHPDAVFIAESRALVTELLEALVTLQSENADLKDELKQYREIGAPCGIKMLINKKNAALSRVETERDVHMAVVAEKDEEIEKLRMQVRVKDACISGKSSIVNHMETERDAARPSAEVLEAIDELVEFARDRMSIGVWLGYVNVLNDWRGAQGEG